MNQQHKVILSIGSNQGNRKDYLMQCIDMLQLNVGTIVSVSSIYESESWGFESDAFYNCAVLMHTNRSAQQIFKSIQKIEKKLGRTRSDQNGYQSRTIDIDIVYFDNEIINTDTLEIPHKEMQNRLFVLLPLQEIAADWVHPVLVKNSNELVSITEDNSSCIKVETILSPLKNSFLDKLNYIAIEGNIGAGKTTLTTKLAQDFNAKTVLERFADNPFLPKFYKDQNRYAFPLEMSFLADRYQQISDDLAQFNLFKDFIIADYHIFKSLIFAKVTLAEDEFRLYKTLFDIIYKEMPKPDLYVYLYQNTERLLQNIKRRGRSFEQEIPAAYLDKINKGYLDYIKNQKDLNVLIIDISELDFIKNQADYIFILNKIQEKLG